MCMFSTADEVITLLIRAGTYILEFFKYGFVSFNDFFGMFYFNI